jgi:hypothetical protein
MHMALVRRIKRSSEQTDHLTSASIWKRMAHDVRL